MVQVRPTVQTHEQIMGHIRRVQDAAVILAKAEWVPQGVGDDLLHQAAHHDCSLYCPSEFQAYQRYWVDLQADDRTGIELDNYAITRSAHHACNAHHPEHWPGAIGGMFVSCILEMVCDWHADLTPESKWLSVVEANIALHNLESIRDTIERAAAELDGPEDREVTP